MFKKILVAYDGSEGSRKALRRAIEMAFCFDAEFHSISVEEGLPQYVATVGEYEEVKRQKDEFFQKLNEEAVELARAGGAKLITHIAPGNEAETIVSFCRDSGFDLLIVGFMGHSRIFDRVWGGTSQTITRLAHCSVLVVK